MGVKRIAGNQFPIRRTLIRTTCINGFLSYTLCGGRPILKPLMIAALGISFSESLAVLVKARNQGRKFVPLPSPLEIRFRMIQRTRLHYTKMHNTRLHNNRANVISTA
ncbi:MAG: hypothetical protein QM501_07280 [Gimesia sp.]